ncbi:MAG: hypothetical protein IPH44_36145 [Myxococcales bacterium]|nr:hypothetical protein [Myxococcales bacterium]MBK7191222.1 hypothetical protein [Myxococcales bacterium]MBP6842596.1 hypothetical protein [Kofleriaceae bacterium]
MKFHGRLHPGRVTDLNQPIEVRIHQPRKAADVTIKIWELDAFLGADGKPRREGTPDDLLATFVGSIEPAPPGGGRKPDWRAFKVASATIEPAPPDALMIKLRFPGSDTVYDVPILSEAAEIEGTEYELGLSIEIGGAEQFRTKAPTLLAPAKVVPRVREVLIAGFDDNGDPLRDGALELPPTETFTVVGRAPAGFDEDSPDPAVLDASLEKSVPFDVTGGFLRRVAQAADDGASVALAANRRLRAFFGAKDDRPLVARSVPIEPDGTITVYRVDTSHRRTFYAGGGVAPTSTRVGERSVPGVSSPLEGRPRARRADLLGAKLR